MWDGNMYKNIPLVALCASLAVAGCASRPSSVGASYVSPLLYQPLSCEQLSMEAQRVSARAAEASGAQSQEATRDAVMTGVALVLFWPAAFAVGGDGRTAAELARLKGEMDAIEQASIQKNCGIVFQREAPPPKSSTPARSDPASDTNRTW